MLRSLLWFEVAVLVVLLGISPWGLWERDEGRYADVAREMLERDDFVTPRINGAVFFDKPPLVYWVTAASLAAWGMNEVGARFGQSLFAVGTLLLTWRIGLRLFDPRRATLAVLVLASSAGFFAAAHVLTLDAGLAFGVTLTLFCFLEGWRAGPAGGRWYTGMFAAAALAVLAKGPVGALLPAMTIALFLTLRREWKRALEMRVALGVLVFLVIALPWFVAVSVLHPEFPGYFFLHENLARFATTTHHRAGAWYYYVAVAALGLLPWSVLATTRLLRSRPRAPWRPPPWRSEAGAFLTAWFLPGFLFFSVAQSKLPLYLTPLYPAAALAIAAVLDRDRIEALGLAACLWAAGLFVVSCTVGRNGLYNETGRFASILGSSRAPGERVYLYHTYLRGLPFYLGGPVGIVSFHSDDLAMGIENEHDPGSFVSETEFRAALSGEARVFAVVPIPKIEALKGSVGRPLFELTRSHRHCLLSNRPRPGPDSLPGPDLDARPPRG